MRYFITLLAAITLLGLGSCEKDTNVKRVQHDVTSVAGPGTGNVNTGIVLTVTYHYLNGCDFIDSFEESKAGNIVTIKAYGKPIPKGTVCTQDVGTRTIEYKFRSAMAGTFELKFAKTDGSTVDHTITVQ